MINLAVNCIDINTLAATMSMFKNPKTADTFYIELDGKLYSIDEIINDEKDRAIFLINVIVTRIDSIIDEGGAVRTIFRTTRHFNYNEVLETCSNGKGVMIHQFLSIILTALDNNSDEVPCITIERNDGSFVCIFNQKQAEEFVEYPNDIIKDGYIYHGHDTYVTSRIFIRTK